MHPAHQIVLAEYNQAIEDVAGRLDRLTRQVPETAASWSMVPVVAAYQAMRGVAFMTAVTFVLEIGDVRRFDNPRQFMAYLGLLPSESSTGERVKRSGIPKAGNLRACRVLVESAWTYRIPARVSPTIKARLEGLPRAVGDRLESVNPALRALSKADHDGRAENRRCDSDRARDGRAFVGDLTGSRTDRAGISPSRRRSDKRRNYHPLTCSVWCAKLELGGAVGDTREPYVADTIRCPILGRGSSRRTHGNAVVNPRIRVCQPSSRCLVSYFAHQLHDLNLVSDDGKDASCRIILKTNIRGSGSVIADLSPVISGCCFAMLMPAPRLPGLWPGWRSMVCIISFCISLA